MTVDYRDLLKAAAEASYSSYSPESQYPVGCAVLTGDGRIYMGCNIENRGCMGVGICAERTALAKAVSEGAKDIVAVAVYSPKDAGCWPCGVCRQFISEYGPAVDIVARTIDGGFQVEKIEDLLPHPAID